MFKKLTFLLLIISVFLTLGLSVYVNLFPVIYLIGFLILGIFVLIIVLYLLKRKNFLKIIGYILSLVIIILSLLISFVFIKYNDFFDSIYRNNIETNNYVIVVLDKSNYYNLEEVYNKNIGILKTNDSYYNEAINNLKNLSNFSFKEYDNEYLLVDGLIKKECDAILISEAYIGVLNEGIEGLSTTIRIINDTLIEVQIEEDNQVKEYNEDIKNKEIFNVYISGIDTYGKITSVSRSDVNIIATVNTKTNEILLTNIPRDMYVQLDGTSGLKDKLTHAGVYGINTSIGTLENFLEIDINYYVRINFSSLIKIVDYIGGVDVYSSYDFKAGNRYYNKGYNYNLSGEEALAFSRNRYAFSDGDRQRGRNQQQVIAAIINKIVKSNDVNVYLNLVNTLENSFQTNMEKGVINSLIYNQLKNNKAFNISFNDVNGYDSSNYTYSYPWQKLYVMEVDENSLNNAKNMINSVLKNN